MKVLSPIKGAASFISSISALDFTKDSSLSVLRWCHRFLFDPHCPPLSGSWDASAFSILPTFLPTSSITLSIKLKGETTNWNRVTQKASNTQTLHPQYLVMMSTIRQTGAMSRNPPQTISNRDMRNRKGPTTWFIPIIPIIMAWVCEPRSSPILCAHSFCCKLTQPSQQMGSLLAQTVLEHCKPVLLVLGVHTLPQAYVTHMENNQDIIHS